MAKLFLFLWWIFIPNTFFFQIENQTNCLDDSITLDLNFYLMGLDSLDQDITVAIGENVRYLNEEFEGKIIFNLNELFMDPNHEYLPDLHNDFRKRKTRRTEAMVRDVEQSGSINIFLVKTYSNDGSNKALMGFTPIFKAKQDYYQKTTPRLDRIFIAYPSLTSKTTIVHEMGHFLGLKHPWEMNEQEKILAGLEHDSVLVNNHMTYNANVNSFTLEQLNQMKTFTEKFRSYLIKTPKSNTSG